MSPAAWTRPCAHRLVEVGLPVQAIQDVYKRQVIRDTNLDYSSVKFTDSDHQKKRLHSAVADFSDETKSLVAELKKNRCV